MDTLLLNPRTVHKQATGIQTQKIPSKMLAICSLPGPDEQKWLQASNRHPNQKFSEQNARYLLATFWMPGKESWRIQDTVSQRGFYHVGT